MRIIICKLRVWKWRKLFVAGATSTSSTFSHFELIWDITKQGFHRCFFFSGTLGDLWNLSYFGQIKFCHVHQHYLVSVHVFVPSLPFDGDCQPLSHFPIPQGSLLILPRLPTNCCRTCFSVCRMVCRQTHMNMPV